VSGLSQRLGIPRATLDVHQPLVRYGLDSIVAFELTADLENWLGCPLPLTLAWDYPTITAIARLSLSRFMIYCASHERRPPLWLVYGAPMCSPAPQSSWI
jgi:acyl carrier protein